jgi:RNA polymerase sigma-70 factor (ECF subfamily)
MEQLTIRPAADEIETIVEGCRKKDLPSQEKLYRICYEKFIKMCNRYAGDMDGAGVIFNNAMLRVFKYIEKYRNENKLMGWIKVIVLNCCLDYVKQKHKLRFEKLESAHEEEIGIPAEILSNVSAKDIQQLILQLPPTTATVFNLFVYDGCSHKEIGTMLNIADGTSKWHVNEGRRLLRLKLNNL